MNKKNNTDANFHNIEIAESQEIQYIDIKEQKTLQSLDIESKQSYLQNNTSKKICILKYNYMTKKVITIQYFFFDHNISDYNNNIVFTPRYNDDEINKQIYQKKTNKF